MPPESPTLGLTHLQFEALLTGARMSSNQNDFALVCLLGLLGLRVFEATGISLDDLGEEHGHRVVRVHGKGGKVVLVPLPPAVSRAVDLAAGDRATGALLLNQRGLRMDRHAATRRLRQLALVAGVRLPRMHPHMLRHTYVTTMLDAGVDLRDVQIAARTPTLEPPCATTGRATTSTVTRTTSSPPAWRLALDARASADERAMPMLSPARQADLRQSEGRSQQAPRQEGGHHGPYGRAPVDGSHSHRARSPSFVLSSVTFDSPRFLSHDVMAVPKRPE